MLSFPYFKQEIINAELEVEDIGNVAIKAFDDLGNEFVLVIDTYIGFSRIFQFGPIRADLDVIPDYCSMSYSKIEFNQRSLVKTIDAFVNRKGVTQAVVVDKEDALGDCTDIINFMYQREF